MPRARRPAGRASASPVPPRSRRCTGMRHRRNDRAIRRHRRAGCCTDRRRQQQARLAAIGAGDRHAVEGFGQSTGRSRRDRCRAARRHQLSKPSEAGAQGQAGMAAAASPRRVGWSGASRPLRMTSAMPVSAARSPAAARMSTTCPCPPRVATQSRFAARRRRRRGPGRAVWRRHCGRARAGRLPAAAASAATRSSSTRRVASGRHRGRAARPSHPTRSGRGSRRAGHRPSRPRRGHRRRGRQRHPPRRSGPARHASPAPRPGRPGRVPSACPWRRD